MCVLQNQTRRLEDRRRSDDWAFKMGTGLLFCKTHYYHKRCIHELYLCEYEGDVCRSPVYTTLQNYEQ